MYPGSHVDVEYIYMTATHLAPCDLSKGFGALRGGRRARLRMRLTLELTQRFTLARMSLTVGHVARRAGVSPHTVRYYDRVGLLKAASRTEAGYREYSEDALERLRFIQDAQRLGLRLQDIRELLEIRDRGQCPCGHTRQLVEKRLTLVRAEIRRLRDIESELDRMLENENDAGYVWCCPA